VEAAEVEGVDILVTVEEGITHFRPVTATATAGEAGVGAVDGGTATGTRTFTA
jgi:hypothetical protein